MPSFAISLFRPGDWRAFLTLGALYFFDSGYLVRKLQFTLMEPLALVSHYARSLTEKSGAMK